MASFMEALKSARAAQKVLFYIQAVDVPLNHAASSEADAQRLHRALLQVPSLSQTKRLPAFCLLHIGMQVRLTTTLHQPYAVQDATATVLEIHFADNDAQAHQHMRGAKHVDVLLDLLPVAVLIQLHDCKHVFLPVGPCSRCSSFADICLDCQKERRKLEGVFCCGTSCSHVEIHNIRRLNHQRQTTPDALSSSKSALTVLYARDDRRTWTRGTLGFAKAVIERHQMVDRLRDSQSCALTETTCLHRLHRQDQRHH